jgi:hypothetical protein
MGMFDFVRSSYDLGPQFTDVQLQTKDIEEFGIGGSMTNYLDPSGYLCYGDYTGTSTFEEISKDDERYSDKHLFLNFEWIQQGKEVSIKFIPLPNIFQCILLNGRESGTDWPTLRLHFIRGKLQDFEDITGTR